MKQMFLLSMLIGISTLSRAQPDQSTAFNAYVLRAVEKLSKERSNLGYGNHSYTQVLKIGSTKLQPTGAPLTMCVAAQMEIIVTALNLYFDETGDESALKYLPPRQWLNNEDVTFKAMMWLSAGSGSRGTAHALQSYGMGMETSFSKLMPGAFINLNRPKTKRHNATGHAVTFLGYLDAQGNIVNTYNSSVAGFKYFSSQGAKSDGGFSVRYAFFERVSCPMLDNQKKVDCEIIESTNQRMLNTGFMLKPEHWQHRLLSQMIKRPRTKTVHKEQNFDIDYFNGETRSQSDD